jgi:O-antigen ligase
MRALLWSPADIAILLLTAFGVLWKGGKGLEATWLLVAIAAFCTMDNWKRHRTTPLDAPIIASHIWLSGVIFFGWTVLSYITSVTQNYGLDEVLRDGALLLIFFWCARRPLHGKDGRYVSAEILLWWLAILAVAAAEIGILVYMFQPVNRMVGTFFDYRFHTDYWPNAWAQFLLLAWPAATWRFHHAQARTAKLGWLFGLGLLIGSLLLSYSRGAFIACMGQLTLFALLIVAAHFRQQTSLFTKIRLWFSRKSYTWMLGYILVPCIAIGLFTLVNMARGQFFAVQDVGEKITFTASEGSSSKTERVQFWRQAMQFTVEKPITGFGPYSFRFIQPYVQQGVLATSDHPHNVFLKFSMERGIPAAFAWLSLLLFVLLPAIRRQLVAKSAFEPRALMIIAVLGVLAHNMIDYNLQFVGIALPFMMMLGFLASGVHVSSLKRTTLLRTEIILACGLLIVAVIEARTLFLSSLGRHAEAAGNGDEAIAWYALSEGELLSRDMELSHAALLLETEDAKGARYALQRYQSRNAVDYRLLKQFGQLAEATGLKEEAATWYVQAFAAGKYNDVSILNALLRVRVDVSDVMTPDQLREFVLVYREALLTNAHFIDLSSNADEFLVLMDTLSERDPANAKEYQDSKIEVKNHVGSERARYTSRNPGFLW